MSVSGRPVFVLRGAQPSHRDMRPGSSGPDVRQLETALARMGFSPGPVDGRYDGATARRRRGWYESERLGRPSERPTRSSTSCAPRGPPPPRRATHTCRAG